MCLFVYSIIKRIYNSRLAKRKQKQGIERENGEVDRCNKKCVEAKVV